MNDSIELGDYVLLPYNDSEVGKVVAMEALPCGDVGCRVIVSDGTQRTYLLSVLRKVRGHKDKVFATKSNDIKPGDYVRG